MRYVETSQEGRREILRTQDHCAKTFPNADVPSMLQMCIFWLLVFVSIHSSPSSTPGAECRLPMSSGKEVRAAGVKVLLHFRSAVRTHRELVPRAPTKKASSLWENPLSYQLGAVPQEAGSTQIQAKPKPRSAGAIMRFLAWKRKCLCSAIQSWKQLEADRKFQCLSLVQREKIQQLKLSSPNEENLIQCVRCTMQLLARFLFSREVHSLPFSTLNTSLINNRNNKSYRPTPAVLFHSKGVLAIRVWTILINHESATLSFFIFALEHLGHHTPLHLQWLVLLLWLRKCGTNRHRHFPVHFMDSLARLNK